MAVARNTELITLKSNADLTGLQYHFGKLAGTKQVVACGAGELGFILQAAVTSGKPVAVAIGGTSKCRAGGTITVGAKLMSAADSEALAATATNEVIAIALEAAVDQDVFEVLVVQFGILA